MFIALLRVAGDKSKAGPLMKAHNEWIQQGFDEGVCILVGRLQPNQGGAVIAHNISRADLQTRLNADPFVAEGVVHAEILELTPSRAAARLDFLR